MPNINLILSKDLFVPKFFPYLTDYSHRWEFYMGSAGSSKSFFITQKLIYRALQENITILVCRRYGTTLRNSCFSLFKQIINQWKLTPYVKINEAEMKIVFKHNNSTILFCSLDDEQKLLSINDIGTVFVEEAYEVTQEVVEQLNLRLRGHNSNQQIILAWNPISSQHWLYNFVNNPPDNSLYLHSTFVDNPFLPEENRKAILELKERNPQKWRIFGEGQWGVPIEGLVFTNWEVKEFDELELSRTMQRRAAADEGFTDPSAIVDTLYDEPNKTVYVYNQFYKTGQTLDQIYQAMVDMHLNRTKVFIDSAAPRLIDYLRKKGINAQPCIKGQGSVEARITFLQNLHIVVHPRCVDVIRELENFSYIKDKNGQWTKNTTHEFSHSLDALGYAYSDIYTKGNIKVLDKSILF